MAGTIRLEAKTREATGTTAVRRLRRTGALPGVVYNDKGETVNVQMDRHGFQQMLRHHRSESLILDLVVDGGAVRKVLLKEVQHDPITNSAVHVDLQEVSMTRKMRVGIAIELFGDPVGVTQGGGILETLSRSVEVECLPADLVESFRVDVSALNVGDSLHVSDLKLDPKFHIITDPAIAIAGVVAPKMEEEAAPAEEGAGAAEPEVIGAKKEEGEEAAEPEEGKKEKKDEGKKEKKDEGKKEKKEERSSKEK
jgi:large subunit ribosomal protein L25